MSKSKRTGTAFETAVVRFLDEAGVPAYRPAPAGSQDKGDVRAGPWVLECKATRDIRLAEAVDEALTEMANDGATKAAAVIKRRRRNVADAYVVLPLWMFAVLLRGDDS